MTRGAVILVLLTGSFITSEIVNANFLDYQTEEDPLDLLRRYVKPHWESRRTVDDELENWKGQWMPHRPDDPVPPPKVFPKTDDQLVEQLSQYLHRVPMGQPSQSCDDAKTNLTVDWNNSPVNYTCYDSRIIPDRELRAMQYCELVPKNYVAMHKCMDESIQYDSDIPLYGTHRPLWPIYGEYKFLPKQRWLHSLEHGGIVMLYHPCANPLEIKLLKNLVTGCLRRHVISPNNLLPENRPLALLSWGCRLTMSYVNPQVVTRFIHEHALRGPEEISRDGDFNDGLLNPAKIVSDEDDTTLCPNTRF